MAISRRNFLKAGAASAAWLAGAPFLRAQTAALPIVGEGEHRYECLHDWLKPPDDIVFGNTHGVAQDANGLIYIFHTVGEGSRKPDAMVVFDADGKFVKSWGAQYRDAAHGAYLHTEGGTQYFYLCNYKSGTVAKTTLDGEVVWSIGYPAESGKYQRAGEYKPTNATISPDGKLYIADGYGLSYIHVYDLNGKYQKTFGGSGTEPGQFKCPHGLMVDLRGANPVLLVADRGNRRVQTLDLDGRPRGLVDTGTVLPCHFRERNGMVMIPDLQSRVTLIDGANKPAVHLGGTVDNRKLREQPRSVYPAGQFVAPHDAIFDRDGNLVIVEWVPTGRVTKLRKIA